MWRKAKKARTTTPEEPRPQRPPARGWVGRGRGTATMVEAPTEYRGTTNQVCGLWPFAVGAGAPLIGVPLGRHMSTRATVCCDPISWYQQANLISNPSVFFMADAGLGKTSAVTRMAVGLSGRGTIPLVLGDTRPDYVTMTEKLNGQVINLGPSGGALNVLDPGEAPDAAARLRAAGFNQAADQVIADALGVRINMVEALITIKRKTPPTDREDTILSRAMAWLDEHHDGVPVVADLLEVIRSAPDELREAALDRGNIEKYRDETEGLEASLVGLLPGKGSRFGNIFGRPTTAPMRRDRAVNFDVSSIPESDGDLRAAALMACWSVGFATVGIAQMLADYRLEPRRHYFVILDELHQALKAGPGLVERLDYLTRLNRTTGVGQAMITHTMKDLMSLPNDADRQKALGFIERSGVVVCGGLPKAEMPLLTPRVPMSRQEQELLSSWQTPPAWNATTGQKEPPPGRGKFLIKVGGRPGIPVDVILTRAELSLSQSAVRWTEQSRTGLLDEESAA